MLAAACGAIRYSAAFCMVLAFVACNSESPSRANSASDLRRWVANTRAQSTPAQEASPLMPQFELFQYKPDGKRDPFSVASGRGEASASRPDSRRRKQTLEQYPLERLKMVGTIGTGPLRVGLVMAPDMVTYRVLPGVYMGHNEGRVKRVHEDRIELVELASSATGGWSERPAALTLDQ